MRKCPHCGIVCDIHTIGGEHCLSTRLKRSEARNIAARCEFVSAILNDSSIAGDVKLTILEHLNSSRNKGGEQ
jgi:hypothetical protein